MHIYIFALLRKNSDSHTHRKIFLDQFLSLHNELIMASVRVEQIQKLAKWFDVRPDIGPDW